MENIVKPCQSIEESLQSFYDAINELNKHRSKNSLERFYPEMFYYSVLRYLRLVKRKARFYANPDNCANPLSWDVDNNQ